jgi:hypothetical protein
VTWPIASLVVWAMTTLSSTFMSSTLTPGMRRLSTVMVTMTVPFWSWVSGVCGGWVGVAGSWSSPGADG